MKISAVIPTKNRVNDLLEAVVSVIGQVRKPDELIVIDQSDSDEAQEKVSKLVSESGADFDLVYIHDQSVAGLVHAKDRGVSESSGDVVSFLEDDVVLMDDYFFEMEQGFLQNPRMLGCCGVATSVPTFTSFYRFTFSLFHQGLFRDERVSVSGHGEKENKVLLQSRCLSGGISAYRREVFERNRFDLLNEFFMYEDIEFSTRASRIFGKDRFFINTAIRLDHRASPINRYRLAYRWERKMRELFCFYKKNRPYEGGSLSMAWLLVGLLLEALVSSVKLKDYGPITGFCKGCINGVKWKLRTALAE